MKTMLVIAAMGISLAVLSACNTVEGFGEDLQKAGQSVEKAAK